MFVENKCLVHYCSNQALSSFTENNEIFDQRNYCLDHISDPGKKKKQIYDYISSHDKIIGLNASGLVFKNMDISNIVQEEMTIFL